MNDRQLVHKDQRIELEFERVIVHRQSFAKRRVASVVTDFPSY